MVAHSHDLTLPGVNRTLHVESGGDGRDMVLIHGALTTHTDWMGDLFEAFARRGRALAVDRPGHGASRRLRFQGSPFQQAAQIREGLRQLGVESPILVGHSFGAMVASAWASAYPEEISGMMLISPIAFHEFRVLEHPVFGPRALPVIGPVLSQAAQTFDPAMLLFAQKLMFAPQDPPADWLERYPFHQVLSPQCTVAEGEDAAAIFPGAVTGFVNYPVITAPVRIIVGERDHVVYPIRHGKRLAGLLPDAQITTRLDVGHMLHHTATETVFEVCDDLLAAVDEDQGRRAAE